MFHLPRQHLPQHNGTVRPTGPCKPCRIHRFVIDSAATSTEEIGNGPHHGTVAKLRQVGVPVLEHYAKQVRKSDYRNFDHIIGMDQWNYRNMMRIFGKDPEQKVSLLLDFTDRPGEIADPWYTGNFDETYEDLIEGCEAFLEELGV